MERANRRHHRRIECRPVDRLGADRAAMVGLPPVPPVVGWRTSTRLSRDHYVRIASNDYSVHPSAIGHRVEVVVDLEQVTVTCGGRLAAAHERCWDVHQTLTDSDHAAAAQAMRRTKLRAVTSPAEPAKTEVEVRQLASYDALFGINDTDSTDGTDGMAGSAGWRDGSP